MQILASSGKYQHALILRSLVLLDGFATKDTSPERDRLVRALAAQNYSGRRPQPIHIKLIKCKNEFFEHVYHLRCFGQTEHILGLNVKYFVLFAEILKNTTTQNTLGT